jgi:hypothetical protein
MWLEAIVLDINELDRAKAKKWEWSAYEMTQKSKLQDKIIFQINLILFGGSK